MKKAIGLVVFMFFLVISQTYAQHVVGDVEQYDGWYKITFEVSSQDNSISYVIYQCYPNGDELEVKDKDRNKLPLFMKVICLGMVEEVFEDQLDSLEFEEDGVYLKVTGFSFIMKFSKSEEEILESLGDEMVDQYKNRSW